MATATANHAAPSVIVPDRLYHISAAQECLGWGAHAMRQARRKGLSVAYIGGRAYVHGSDIIEFIRENAKPSK